MRRAPTLEFVTIFDTAPSGALVNVIRRDQGIRLVALAVGCSYVGIRPAESIILLMIVSKLTDACVGFC
jgi:hypothetical protein